VCAFVVVAVGVAVAVAERAMGGSQRNPRVMCCAGGARVIVFAMAEQCRRGTEAGRWWQRSAPKVHSGVSGESRGGPHGRPLKGHLSGGGCQ